jgi:Cyclin-dependent kinase inhibitor
MKATGGSESKASSKWEFDFRLGKPARIQKNFNWEALPSSEVPKVYRVNHFKRLNNSQNNFEGQLPKLRYYHHIKKVEPLDEENDNKNISIKTQPITASSKKNGSNGQMKITGEKPNFNLLSCDVSGRIIIA